MIRFFSMSNKKKNIKASLYIWLLFLTITIGIFLGIAIGSYTSLPDVVNLESIPPSLITKIHSDDDEVIAEYSLEYRKIVSFDQIPQHLIDAIVATEDSNFFKHWGIEPKGIIRAFFKDIKTGRFSQGGSTITQQLAKVLLLTQEKKVKRKVREILLALEIEKKYSKNQILEFYFNWIFFGHNYYGVGAAAKGYFNKELNELNLGESALLAGLVRSPNRYSPFNNFKNAVIRRNYVFRRLLEEKKITETEYRIGVSEYLEIVPYKKKHYDETYFVERTRKYLEKNYGFDAIYTKGLSVHTTLNLELQNTAVKAVKDGLEKLRKRYSPKDNTENPKGKIQAALIAIETKTGQIKAYVGGEDFSESKFDCVYQAQRQPGSGFKPFVFATAFEADYRPTDIIIDSPIEHDDPTLEEPWSPRNYYETFFGPVTLRTMLELSINVASVKLLEKIGPENAVKTARSLGIKSPLYPYFSLALGAFEVNLEEMTSAFSAFANQGVRIEPTFIRYISDSNGKTIEEGNIIPHEALTPQVAFITNNILQGVIKYGTGKMASSLKGHLGGKTGTTNEYHDAWFIGYSPYITAGVWVGREEGLEPIGEKATGAVAALPIWIEFMEKALETYPDDDFEIPSGIRFVTICKEKGCIPERYCDDRFEEAFIAGTENIPRCQ